MKVDHTVGSVRLGRLEGPAVPTHGRDVVAGPIKLRVTPEDRGLRVEPMSPMGPEQALRALHAGGVVTAAGTEHGRLRVSLTCERGRDEAIYSADLRHRLVYRRVYDPRGPVATWVGVNPFLSDLEGDPSRTPPRPSMRNAVGVLTNELGALGTLHILNLFTRRSREVADIEADSGDRLVHDDVIREALDSSDVVLPAWGGKVGERHLPRVRHLLDRADELDLPVMIRARDGQPLLTSAWPRQPTHPRVGGYKALHLVEAPPSWRRSFTVEMSR